MYYNHLLRASILLLSLCATNVQCASTIVKPGSGGDPGDYEDNPVYAEGTDITFKWVTDIDNIKVIVWQDYPTPGNGKYWWETALANGGKNTTVNWKATPLGLTNNLKDNEDIVLYYGLYKGNSDTRDDVSHYFNISRVANSKVQVTKSGAAKAPTPTASQGSAPAISTPALPNYNDDSLSCGAIAGISVGATIGGIILLGGLGFFAGRQFQKAFNRTPDFDNESPKTEHSKPISTPETTTSGFTSQTYYQPQTQYQQQTDYQPQSQWQPPVEAPVPRVVHEAP